MAERTTPEATDLYKLLADMRDEIYGLPIWSFAGATDAKAIDAQAGAEGMLSIITSMLSRCNFIHDVGYIESGHTSSLEMLTLADELIGMSRYFIDGLRIDVAHFVMKDPRMRDNPPVPDDWEPVFKAHSSEYDSQLHINDMGHSDNHLLFRDLRALLDSYQPARYAVGEIYVSDWEEWATYYGEELDELRDEGKHHRQRTALRSPDQRLQLHPHDTDLVQADTDRPPAQRRVRLILALHIGQHLVRADVERAEGHALAGGGIQHQRNQVRLRIMVFPDFTLRIGQVIVDTTRHAIR